MQLFVDSPLLTIFFCVGVGSLFGRIRFGPVSFGPAGALFAALALSAIEPDVALPPLITSLSLCVFCYMVGIAAGPAFIGALRSGWQPIIVSVLAILAMAAAALGVGKAFDLDIATVAGAFSGAGTATAALGAVQQQLADGAAIPPEPAIGYAVAYPITVLLTILACSYLIGAGRRSPTAEDREKVSPIVVRTLELVGDPALSVRGLSDRYEAVVSRLTRDGHTVVAHDDQVLAAGDLLTITAREDVVGRLVSDLGRPAAEEPWLQRSDIDFRRITLSNTAATIGATVGSIAGGATSGGSFTALPAGVTRIALPGQGGKGAAAAPGGKAFNAWFALSNSDISYDYAPLQSSGKVRVGLLGIDYTFKNSVVAGLAIANDKTDVDLKGASCGAAGGMKTR